jgi:O-antigen/teichoic acid export membrane protein
MAKKIIRDVSSSTIQVILNQVLGLAIFYILSRYLSIEDFGELNWSIAVVSTLIILVGVGLEQIVLKRVAIRNDHALAARVFIFHTLLSSLLFFSVLVILTLLLGSVYHRWYLFPGIAISALITYLSSPFKQIANGKEKFQYLAIMSLAANVSRSVLLALTIAFFSLSLYNIVLIYIISALIELLISTIIVSRKLKQNILPVWDKREFLSLIKESFPQLGVLIFDSALARIDWIMLGIFSGAVATAEYSFAYKVFEISRLPMLIIAPVLLPKLSRYFIQHKMDSVQQNSLHFLLRLEAIIAMVIPIALNLCWVPLVSDVTADKYGLNNRLVYLILSFSVPMHYLTNFLWTMAFAQRQIRLTFYITVAVSVSNILLNFVLIRFFGTTGAAIAFTSSTLLQVILYKKYVDQRLFKVEIADFIICVVCAVVIVFVINRLEINYYIKSIMGVLAYLLIVFALRVIRLQEIRKFQVLLAR